MRLLFAAIATTTLGLFMTSCGGGGGNGETNSPEDNAKLLKEEKATYEKNIKPAYDKFLAELESFKDTVDSYPFTYYFIDRREADVHKNIKLQLNKAGKPGNTFLYIMNEFDEKGFTEFDTEFKKRDFALYLKLGMVSMTKAVLFDGGDREDLEEFQERYESTETEPRNLSQFRFSTKQIQNHMNSQYVLVVKSMVSKAPKAFGGTLFDPGEINVACILFERESGNIVDIFSLNPVNSQEVEFQQKSDYSDATERLQEAIERDLLYALRDDLEEALKTYYTLNGTVPYFDYIYKPEEKETATTE